MYYYKKEKDGIIGYIASSLPLNEDLYVEELTEAEYEAIIAALQEYEEEFEDE